MEQSKEEGGDRAGPKRKGGWFGRIEDFEAAKSAARGGALAGLVFAAMYGLTFALDLFLLESDSPVTNPGINSTQLYTVIANGLFLICILFLSWRVFTTKGYISAGILGLWFLGEAAFKIATGTAGFGWIFFYLAILAAFVNGCRGCWKARQLRALAKSIEAF